MKDYISQARLDTYKNILKLKDEENILRAYYWSKALSASIYPIMQTLEITFRNALNLAVKSNHNGKYANDDWWLEHIATTIQDMKIKKMSPTNKKKWLNPDGSRKKQSFAEQQILKVIHDLKKEARLPIHHDDVISRMTFGYWINMLGKDYEDVTHKTLLWPNLLTSVFPNTTHKPKRHIVETVFQRTRDLRNRLSHHEPIWKFYQTNNNGQLDYSKPIYGLQANLNLLQRAYSEMLQTIRWMSEDRYQSFLQAGLDTEFQRLCSLDGFYNCVTPQLKTVAFEGSHSETNT